jgi:hypothetical protein
MMMYQRMNVNLTLPYDVENQRLLNACTLTELLGFNVISFPESIVEISTSIKLSRKAKLFHIHC